MTEHQDTYNHAPKHQPKKRGISASVLILAIALTAVVGFVAGTRSNDILAVIGPVFNIKVHTGTLDLTSVEKTYQALKANYDGELDDQKLIEGANRGLVAAAGDQYTVYMSSQDKTDFENDLSGKIGGGIGAEIGLRNKQPTIIRTLKGNPAENAGLNAGDVILSVNDQSAAAWTVEETVKQIRGEAGTTVKVSVLRGEEQKEFTITREVISSPSVESKIENNVGILTISRFDEQSGDLARAAAQDFKQKGVKAVVLDLRGNGGGYVTAAQDVAGLWLDNKVVVSERTGDTVVDELKSGSNPVLAGISTVVLVNAGSASASEIVAGALQDHGAAKLVGEKTFGKGSVQKLIELPDNTQLKVTVARWYTPNGKNITKEGIQPDVTAGLTQADVDSGTDPQLAAALKTLGL